MFNQFNETLGKLKDHLPNALWVGTVITHDHLAFAWASVQEYFGDDAKPEHAIALLKIMLEQCERERVSETIPAMNDYQREIGKERQKIIDAKDQATRDAAHERIMRLWELEDEWKETLAK